MAYRCSGHLSCVAVLALLLLPVASFAQQPSSTGALPQTAPLRIASPAISELASRLEPAITRQHFSSIVVVGAAGPSDQATELGEAIGDALSDSLAQQAEGFTVIGRSQLRALLNQKGLSSGFLVGRGYLEWITGWAHAKAAVFVQLVRVQDSAATVEATLFDVSGFHAKTISSAEVSVPLNEPEADAAHRTLGPDDPALIQIDEGNSPGSPQCAYCPRPEYSQEARDARLGPLKVLAAVTVKPDGNAGEIKIISGVGHGMDESMIAAIRGWKFKPAMDSDGHPIAKRIVVEGEFELFSGKGN